MNKVIISGNLVEDLDPNDSMTVASTRIAVDRPYPFNKGVNGKKITDFLTIKFIGEKRVRTAAQYLKKGNSIIITGINCRDTFKDKRDDTWKEYNYIIVEEYEYQRGKSKDGETTGDSITPGESNIPIPEDLPNSPDDSFMDIPIDTTESLPFKK